jgi:parvulin-like peptidyl-prolyl isomerase
VKDRAAADEIVAAVHKGEEFDRLARERSMESRAAQAGDRRWVNLQDLPAPLRDAVTPLKAGEISEPLQGSAESIVVRLEERRPARTKTLAEARPEIEQRLLPARQREVVLEWLAEQERKSKIEILLEEARGA